MKTVKDVMSALPVSVSETASFREIAARLRECRVSAFPVLDVHGKVTGVVSEADLLVKEAVPDEPNVIWGLLAGIVHHAAWGKAGAVTAADLMTSPAITIGPDDTVEHAARLMYDRKVKRLPVVDQAGRPIGIISRQGWSVLIQGPAHHSKPRKRARGPRTRVSSPGPRGTGSCSCGSSPTASPAAGSSPPSAASR